MDGGELCSARCAEQPFDVGFHPNSQIFVAGLITGEVEVWERDAARDAARKLKTVRCHDAACRTLAFVNDGALLLTGSSDRSILATDVATSKPLARLTNAHKAAVNRIISIDANTSPREMTTGWSRCGTPESKPRAVSSRRSSTSSPT
jgi:WD40 repeat protein